MVRTMMKDTLLVVNCYYGSDTLIGEVGRPKPRCSTSVFAIKGSMRMDGVIEAIVNSECRIQVRSLAGDCIQSLERPIIRDAVKRRNSCITYASNSE